ncbi:MAG TPA: hypothetical protein VFX20_14000 [Steroidobacteraceae bacterium]|nr:hypothetical protein [Steroidobacteraceae bacterium]
MINVRKKAAFKGGASKAKKERRPRTRSHSLRAGTHVIWPAGLEEILGLSSVTRWRWERDGKLPARDFSIAGRTGWKRQTIENALQMAPGHLQSNADLCVTS